MAMTQYMSASSRIRRNRFDTEKEKEFSAYFLEILSIFPGNDKMALITSTAR
jgi:hypothetical protein